VEESRAGTATLDEVAARLDELGKLMAKVQDLELKMQDLEAQANLKEQQIKKTRKVKDAVKSKSERHGRERR
jgi:proteasome assembly chaperone (PAC2) family protein